MEEEIKLMVKSSTASEGSENDRTILKMTAQQQAKSVRRTKEWLVAASRELLPQIEKLQKVTSSQDGGIRSELKVFCETILRRCQRNMPSCTSTLLQTRIALDVEGALSEHKMLFDDDLLDIVEELFIAALTKMPRMMCTGDEDEQIAVGNEIYGLIAVLERFDRLKIVLSNERIIRILTSALISAVELELHNSLFDGNIRIYEIGGIIAAETIDDLRSKTPWKRFRNIRSGDFVQTLEAICRLIGGSGDAGEFLIEELLRSLHINTMQCNEVLVLLQMTMKSTNISRSAGTSVIEELLREMRWELSTETTVARQQQDIPSEWFEDRTEGLYESAIAVRFTDLRPTESNRESTITLGDVKFNILHMCLTMEALGICAENAREEFRSFLLFSLHRILEKAASKYQVIQMAAVLTLNSIRNALGLTSIADLIIQNADYITHSIAVSLKHSDRSETALDILRVVLHYCSLESIPHLENIITTVLHENSRQHQAASTLSFLKVFSMILKAVLKSIGQNTKEEPSSAAETDPSEDKKGAKWLSFLDDDAMLDDDLIDETMEKDLEERENRNEGEEMKLPLPPLVEQTVSILHRCIHSLSSVDRDQKIVALEAINVGLDILRPHEDELLQIVHLIWTPFVQQCIRDKSAVTLRRCVALLSRMAKYAKRFIYKRCET